jgi:hypothetical protein
LFPSGLSTDQMPRVGCPVLLFVPFCSTKASHPPRGGETLVRAGVGVHSPGGVTPNSHFSQGRSRPSTEPPLPTTHTKEGDSGKGCECNPQPGLWISDGESLTHLEGEQRERRAQGTGRTHRWCAPCWIGTQGGIPRRTLRLREWSIGWALLPPLRSSPQPTSLDERVKPCCIPETLT